MVQAQVCGVKVVAQMRAAPSTTHFALGTEPQVDGRILVNDAWCGWASVANVWHAICAVNWGRMETRPWPLGCREFVELLMWHPQRSTTARAPEHALRILIVWCFVTRHAAAQLLLCQLTADLRKVKDAHGLKLVIRITHVILRATRGRLWPSWASPPLPQSMPCWRCRPLLSR